MPLIDRSAAAVALLTAVVLSVAALGVGVIAAGAAQPQTKALQAGATPGRTVVAQRTSAPSATTTAIPADDGRSAPVTVLLVGAGALVGITVGLIPAVLAAKLLGLLPARPRRRAHPEDLLVEPPRAPRAPPPAGPVTLAAAPDPVPERPPAAPRPRPRPVVARAAAPAPGPPPEIAERRARHRALYDAEYAKQLERLAAQREAISTDVAEPVDPRPPRRAGSRRAGGGPSPGPSHD